MSERKSNIKLRYGKVKALANIFGCSTATVKRALRWHADTELENKIRERARTLGFQRNF